MLDGVFSSFGNPFKTVRTWGSLGIRWGPWPLLDMALNNDDKSDACLQSPVLCVLWFMEEDGDHDDEVSTERLKLIKTFSWHHVIVAQLERTWRNDERAMFQVYPKISVRACTSSIDVKCFAQQDYAGLQVARNCGLCNPTELFVTAKLWNRIGSLIFLGLHGLPRQWPQYLLSLEYPSQTYP